jgi:hypothetical protein
VDGPAVVIDQVTKLVSNGRSSTGRLLGPQRPLVPHNPVSIPIRDQLEAVVASEHFLLVGLLLGWEDGWLLNCISPSMVTR